MAVLNPRAACDCRIARSFSVSCTVSEDFTSSYDRSDEQQGLAVRGVRPICRAHKWQAKTIAAVQARRPCPSEEAERSDLTLSCRKSSTWAGCSTFSSTRATSASLSRSSCSRIAVPLVQHAACLSEGDKLRATADFPFHCSQSTRCICFLIGFTRNVTMDSQTDV